MFYSPPINCNGDSSRKTFLPGFCSFIPDLPAPQRPPIRDDIEQSSSVLNVSCCFLQCRHFKVAVASVYQSPSTDIKQSIEDLLPKLSSHSQYIVLAGDLNIDLQRQSKQYKIYNDCLTDFQLKQLITEPSRVSSLSSTLIDHIACSSKLSVYKILQTIGVSDHRVQIVEISVLYQAPETCYVRSFRKCDRDIVRACLSNAPWSDMKVFDKINDMWEYFYATILYGRIDSHIPLKSLSNQSDQHLG